MANTPEAAPGLVDPVLADRLFRRSGADRWSVPRSDFAAALERSVRYRFKGAAPARAETGAYIEALHHEDLALACACARGDERAWDHFVSTFRPVLYRTAAALAGPDAGRELADSIYAELYGLEERSGRRRSLFEYFHGRSTLAGWLRSVLAQRNIDRAREQRRSDPLPDEEVLAPDASPNLPDPDRPRYVALLRGALLAAVAALDPRDRLRLSLYYVQDLTLAQVGRVLGEHEATVSRKLDRLRRQLRTSTEQSLRDIHRLRQAEIDRCFELAVEDWAFDLEHTLAEPDA
jgi:RNA polymerase sigma-70 factor, ECF subfamily